MPHSNICMWTDYITNWESGGGEKFHLANDASVCPTCPTTPAHATRRVLERERVRETFSPARLSALRRFSRSARAVREKGPGGPVGRAVRALYFCLGPSTADQLAYLPTRLPIFRIADTHLHTAAAAAGLACPAGETSTCHLGSDHQ